MLIIMNKLELVRTLRQIAAIENCHLTLRAALKIANWLKDGTAYDITSYLRKQEKVTAVCPISNPTIKDCDNCLRELPPPSKQCEGLRSLLHVVEVNKRIGK